jgi:hypothetical protein
MMKIAALVVLAACHDASVAPPPLSPERVAANAPALEALRGAKFTDAVKLAGDQLAAAPRDSEAAAIRGLAAYVTAADQFVVDTDVGHSWFIVDALVDEHAHAALETFIAQVDRVDRDLAIAAADPHFSLELCIACWEYDWNHRGEIDDRDRKLLEVEVDAQGKELPEGDPRRRPTFHFDVGDVFWARAMLAFQRAALDVVLAYRWNDAKHGDAIVIPLVAPDRVKQAKVLLLAGLDFADQARRAYLQETDDDREWLPNPRQTNHGIPLDVDDQLYATWADVIGDVRRLVRGDEGLSLHDVAELVEPRAALLMPDAYIDVSAMLSQPTDIKLDADGKLDDRATIEKALRGVLGHGFAEHMKASPLVKRLADLAMARGRGEHELARKLRYLIWLN